MREHAGVVGEVGEKDGGHKGGQIRFIQFTRQSSSVHLLVIQQLKTL